VLELAVDAPADVEVVFEAAVPVDVPVVVPVVDPGAPTTFGHTISGVTTNVEIMRKDAVRFIGAGAL